MTELLAVFIAVSNTLSLPAGLLSALCYVESRHNVDAIHVDDGKEDSIGVCQVQLSTAKVLGFKGTKKELFIPRVNAYYAGKYLSKQLKRYNNDVPKAVAAYNAGSHRLNDKGVTRNRKYVDKVLLAWTEGK